MKSVYLLELKSILTSVRGFLFLGITLLLDGVFITFFNFYSGYLNVEYTLEFCAMFIMMTLPLLTVCTFASDRKSGYDVMLFARVKSRWNVLAGKSFAVLTVAMIPCAVIAVIPLIANAFGDLYFKATYIGIFGYFLVTCALCSVGILVSVLTKGKLIGSVVTYGVFVLMYVLRQFGQFITTDVTTVFIFGTVIIALIAIAIYLKSHSEMFCLIFVLVSEAALLVIRFALSDMFIRLFDQLITTVSVLGTFDGFTAGLLKLSSCIGIISVFCITTAISYAALESRK